MVSGWEVAKKRESVMSHEGEESRLVEQIFDLSVNQTTGIIPRVGEYLINVTYAFPAMSELEQQFDAVSSLFAGSYEWEQHKSRKDFDKAPGDKIFFVKHFTSEEIKEMGGPKSEHIIAWGLKNGYVVADEKELYAFGINPETRDLQRSFWIVALGSSTMAYCFRSVAMLFSDAGGRILGIDWFNHDRHSDYRFLFVRN